MLVFVHSTSDRNICFENDDDTQHGHIKYFSVKAGAIDHKFRSTYLYRPVIEASSSASTQGFHIRLR